MSTEYGFITSGPVQSDTISASLGSIQPYATINARRLLVHISTNVYSHVLIYELTGAMYSKNNLPNVFTQQQRIQTSRKSEAL